MSAEPFAAIEQRDLDRLAKALAAGADPDAACRDPPGWTPLMAAIDSLENGGSVEALVLLLRHGAKVDARDAEDEANPLLMALFRHQMEAVRLLLACNADPSVLSAEGDSPLRWCVERRDAETAAMLLRCGGWRTIDTAGGPSGMTALGRAASLLDVRMVELLLAAGANPTTLDADGRTALERLPTPADEDGQEKAIRVRSLLTPAG